MNYLILSEVKMHRTFNILISAYLSIWIFYPSSILLLNSMILSPEFESDVSKISLGYNYVYQSESSAVYNSLFMGGALIGFLSIVGMFFRLKFSNRSETKYYAAGSTNLQIEIEI